MDFDLVVIGAGPGGYVAAIRASQLGMKVAIIEREALGGICLNWGCIPTKALLKSGEFYETLDHLDAYGLAVTGRSYDFSKVIERSRGVSKQLSSGVAFLMKKHKIEVIEGTAKLSAGSPAPKVNVTLKAGGNRTLQAKHVILATGARARHVETGSSTSQGTPSGPDSVSERICTGPRSAVSSRWGSVARLTIRPPMNAPPSRNSMS